MAWARSRSSRCWPASAPRSLRARLLAPTVVVLSGPSGVGKTRLISLVRDRHPDLWMSVSATTRSPRPGEVDGRDYHFVSRADFVALAERGDFIEWAEYAGNLYGTPRAPVERRAAAGAPALLEIEIEGARQIRRNLPGALLVFVAPPSWEVLVERLVGRGTEPPAVIERRLDRARDELAAEPEFDLTIVNRDAEDTAERLVALVQPFSPAEQLPR